MHTVVIIIKVGRTVTYGERQYDWKGALKRDFREAGKVLFLNPIGDYKGVCLIVLHQAIHLFFTDVLFCNKKIFF